MYKVFTRTWWRNNQAYPNGLEPCAGRKYTIDNVYTEKEAKQLCKEYNDTHHPGRLSLKAEYMET